LALNENGEAIGLAHFFYHPSTSTSGGNCYLQDLFVIPAARGQRVGRRLIAAVAQAAKTKGVAVVYWQTEEFNGPARRLYERVAKRSPLFTTRVAFSESSRWTWKAKFATFISCANLPPAPC
jgi:GNAT superfamily N-acetyltransferase